MVERQLLLQYTIYLGGSYHGISTGAPTPCFKVEGSPTKVCDLGPSNAVSQVSSLDLSPGDKREN